MKAKVKSSGEIVDVYAKSIEHYYDAETNDYYRPNEIEIIPPEKKVVEGYVAIDECGLAFIHTEKPTYRCKEFCDSGEYYGYWESNGGCYQLDDSLFPDMDCESEPRRVRIEITLIDEKGE